jgi:hypothetical protein
MNCAKVLHCCKPMWEQKTRMDVDATVTADAILTVSSGSHSRLSHPGGPGHRTYIPQKQGGPVTPSDTVFSLRRVLWLAGLRWRYSKPPPYGHTVSRPWSSLCIASARTAQKTPLLVVTQLLCVTQPLLSGGCFCGSTVLALSQCATICWRYYMSWKKSPRLFRSVRVYDCNVTLLRNFTTCTLLQV